jgi:flagellar FliL protein
VVLGGGGVTAFMLLQAQARSPGRGGSWREGRKNGKEGKEERKRRRPRRREGESAAPAAGAPVIKEGPDGVVFYTLPDIVVNMQSPDGRSDLPAS